MNRKRKVDERREKIKKKRNIWGREIEMIHLLITRNKMLEESERALTISGERKLIRYF